MKCSEALELLGDHVNDTLARRDVWRLRLHLLICRHCRQYLSAYRLAIRAGKSAFAAEIEAPNPEVPEALVQSILDATRREGAH